MIMQAEGWCAGLRYSYADNMRQLMIVLSSELVQHLVLWQGSFGSLRVSWFPDAWKTCMRPWQFGSVTLQRLRRHLASMS